MVSASMFTPLLVTAGFAFPLSGVHRVVHPAVATKLLGASLVLTLLSALPAALIVSLTYLAHAPGVGSAFAWCAMSIGIHGQIPGIVGAPVLAALLGGSLRCRRVVREFRSVACHVAMAPQVSDRPDVFAVTLPGAAGQIIVSRGLLALLDRHETAVVLAHERSHARHRHDRYLFIARFARAAVPILRPLSSRLEFAVERWADEDAAAAVGDRTLVARTLGRVALAATPSARGALGVSGVGMVGRVRALLRPNPPMPHPALKLAAWSIVGIGGASSAIQMHHLRTLFATLCHS